MGTVFLLRCCTMFVTSLSVPGQHLKCASKVGSIRENTSRLGAAAESHSTADSCAPVLQSYGNTFGKIQRALAIWSGFGMTLTGVQTCGDYMFSGHTVVITMLNFFVTECESLTTTTECSILEYVLVNLWFLILPPWLNLNESLVAEHK